MSYRHLSDKLRHIMVKESDEKLHSPHTVLQNSNCVLYLCTFLDHV